MKLKQQIALGLCAFYLISVIGVALSLHFCGTKLSEVNFTTVQHCKGCKAADKPATQNNCCKTASVEAKVSDAHEAGAKVSLPGNYSVRLFLAPFLSEMVDLILPGLFSKRTDKAPPLSSKLSLYAYNCNFRN